MDAERSHLSSTLPRNFQFHYRDGHMPQTPEPEPQPEELQPPPPPRQTLKVRRRRTTMVQQHNDADFAMGQRPIPTIEAPELHQDISSDLPLAPTQDDAYLSPGFSYTRMLSPPKTPVAQMRTTIISFDGPQHWSDLDQSSQSESSSRPTSSSGFSDSSFSSRGSIESFMSRGGSCTSPEEETSDPFLAFSPDVKYGQPTTSPLPAFQSARPAKRLKMRATFTEDMDHHLWMTYMKYLQDPTVTPFKALPGTVPPNGVCHRVSRMARKTWKGPRSTRLGVRAGVQYEYRAGTDDTIRPLKSASNTPEAVSEASTRSGQAEANTFCSLPASSSSIAFTFTILPTKGVFVFIFVSAPADIIAFLTFLAGPQHVLDPRHECFFGHQHGCIDADRQPSFKVGQPDTTSGSKDLVKCTIVGSSEVAVSSHRSRTWTRTRTHARIILPRHV
jgi:hypothetical protein